MKFSFGKGLKDLVRKFAPTIASGLGGPVAGATTKFLAEKLLGKPDANPTEIEQFLFSASPEKLAELKRLDQEFEIEMAKLDIDVFKLETADTQDARKAGLAMKMIPQMVLSVIFIGGYFTLMFYLFSGKFVITNELKDTGNILLGVMTANIPQIMGFWFGSSHGSKNKDG